MSKIKLVNYFENKVIIHAENLSINDNTIFFLLKKLKHAINFRF